MRNVSFADRVRPMTLNTASVPTLAVDLGFMSREGLDAKVVQCDGTPQALSALEKGDLQFAQVNIAPVVDGVAKGAGLRIVWGLIHGDPFGQRPPASPDMGLILVSSASVSSIGALKGKRIGISMKGATNHHALVPLLRDRGIDPENGVRWVEAGSTPPDRMKSLLAGGIDAMVTTAQTLAAFESRRKDLRILADGRDFSHLAGVQFLVVATTERLAAAEPQVVQSAVNGLVKASRDFSEHPKRWIEGAQKRRPDVPREAIAKAWEQSRGHWPVNGRLGPETAQEAAARLLRSGEITAVPSAPVTRWVDTGFVDAALKELGKWKE